MMADHVTPEPGVVYAVRSSYLAVFTTETGNSKLCKWYQGDRIRCKAPPISPELLSDNDVCGLFEDQGGRAGFLRFPDDNWMEFLQPCPMESLAWVSAE